MYRHMSDGNMFDTCRGLYIVLDKTKPHPQNRTQYHITELNVKHTRDLSSDEVDYLMSVVHDYGESQEKKNDTRFWHNCTRVTKRRQYIAQLQCWTDFQYMWSGHKGNKEQWIRKHLYNQWCILYKHRHGSVEILKPTAKYKRMKNKRALKVEINRLNLEIAALQRKRKRLKQTMNNVTRNDTKNNKTSV